jgi:hypothetical protein
MYTFKKIFILVLAVLIHSCSSSTPSGTAQNDLISLRSDPIESNLGTESSVTISMESFDLSGVVDLEIDRTDLDADFSANDDIVFSLSDTQVTLVKGETSEVTLNVEVKTSAPSFDDGKVKVIGTLPNGDELELEILFQVNPYYEIRLSVDSGTGQHSWDRPAVENFRHHDGNFQIVFINMDHLDEHSIHANGGIDHQSGTMDAAASEGEDGGKYEAIVDQTSNSSTYYCHSHATGVLNPNQTFNFNIDL